MDLRESLPKLGHVNEVCKEWVVREDGALAYRLQSQEINEFYKGNKFRNQVVRQDFPTALNEQIKEKEIAEKQNALYHLLLCEQEQSDKEYAEELAKNVEKIKKERLKEAEISEIVAQQLQVNLSQYAEVLNSSSGKCSNSSSRERKRSSLQNRTVEDVGLGWNYVNINPAQHAHSLPEQCSTPDDNAHGQQITHVDVADTIRHHDIAPPDDRYLALLRDRKIKCALQNEMYTQDQIEDAFNKNCHVQRLSPEKYDYLVGNMQPRKGPKCAEPELSPHIDADVNLKELGFSLEEIEQIEIKLHQEKRDEELARQLQEQEQQESMSQEEKDRLLAIEAQDKELARMLQEREKAKAKRAKEKARLKRQQLQKIGNSPTEMPTDIDNILPDVQDSYSNPVDLIAEERHKPYNEKQLYRENSDRSHRDDEIYALPVDADDNVVRPRSLDIKDSFPRIVRSETSNTISGVSSVNGNLVMSPSKSNSPSSEKDNSPVPPYMPIQGTRRSSDGKKKKYKDKCAHQ